MTNFDETSADRRRPSIWLLASIALAGLVLVAAITVVIARVTGDNDTAASPSAPAEDAATSACGLPDGDQSVPETPPEVTWELTGTFVTPTSGALGPADHVVGVPVCFAHSPSGAVVAAVSYLGATTDPNISRADLIKVRILMDENGQQLAETEEEATDPDAQGAKFQLAGFAVADATRDRTTVDLAIRSSDGPEAGQVYALTLTLVWSDGDWKIAVPATGQPPTKAIASLNGFVEWSGA